MIGSDVDVLVETVGRAIADADDEDYMEDFQRYDHRANAAIKAIISVPTAERAVVRAAIQWVQEEAGSKGALQDACFELLRVRKEAATDWRPLETAPKDGTLLDMWCGGLRLADVYWCDEGDGWAVQGNLIAFPHKLSHWRFAPGPPR